MFGPFGGATVSDSVLGDLRFTRGRWRGLVQFEGKSIPLALSGGRKSPDESAVIAARTLPATFAGLRAQIEVALFEHHVPYAQSVASGELAPPAEGSAEVRSAGDVWRHVEAQFVSIEPMSGLLVTEIGVAVAWDEEHVLGVRFAEERFIELCGSTIPS